MKDGKIIGIDDVFIEVQKCFGEGGIVWLIILFIVIFKINKMLNESRFGTLVTYKNKGDIYCVNNGGI